MDTRRMLVVLAFTFGCGGETQRDALPEADGSSTLEGVASDSSGSSETPEPESDPPPPAKPCDSVVRGVWVREADLPFALDGGTATFVAMEDRLLLLGASDCSEGDASRSRVLSFASPGGAWEEEAGLPLQRSFDGALAMGDDGVLLISEGEPRSVLRSAEPESWAVLGDFPAADAGRMSLAQLETGALVAYVPRSGEVFRSDDAGDTWERLADGPPSPVGEGAHLEPFGPSAVLLTGPGVLRTYDVDTETSEDSVFGWSAPASTTVRWDGERRFGLGLYDCCSGEDWEIAPNTPQGLLVDEHGGADSVGYGCGAPVVYEVADLPSKVLGTAGGMVVVHAYALRSGERRNWLDVFEETPGWSRTSPSPVDLHGARLTMLDDGSVLAVGGGQHGDSCSQEVWRWVP